MVDESMARFAEPGTAVSSRPFKQLERVCRLCFSSSNDESYRNPGILGILTGKDVAERLCSGSCFQKLTTL